MFGLGLLSLGLLSLGLLVMVKNLQLLLRWHTDFQVPTYLGLGLRSEQPEPATEDDGEFIGPKLPPLTTQVEKDVFREELLPKYKL